MYIHVCEFIRGETGEGGGKQRGREGGRVGGKGRAGEGYNNHLYYRDKNSAYNCMGKGSESVKYISVEWEV